MKQDRMGLTQAEWSVMECLWEAGPLTGREVIQRMEQSCGWSRSTTLTLLRRLENKGVLTSVLAEKGPKVFSPLLRREDAALEETKSFLDRVYQGSLSLMVSSLTKKQALPQEELDELYALLKGLEEKEHD
ncbi:MAG: BlaI/MecI/CopY family transcriptional regulator [Evtepia sp.]|uniref:BlaI/MecI/CopY family transcriptional regulator n=1 Tax=Evtepia sp. TaxID=2773933 RepID=UPI002A758E5A|nr:BlaI/MecI/CopY family transcriptional regulator [Evtepia sp.]MDY3013745.1 BlaI/MecI/CopY family transcriptional regulator [Evtepia sp.]